jgi:hypothetical protein
MQGGQSCCFHQAAAALPFSCSSDWSSPTSASPGNSVLNTALCSRDWLACCPTPASRNLCFSQSLLSASGSVWRLICHPTPVLSLYSSPDLCLVPVAPLGSLPYSCYQLLLFYLYLFTESSVLRIWFLALLPFSGSGSVFHSHLLSWC